MAARLAKYEAQVSNTEELLDFWDETFGISFAECRRRLKVIAHESWTNVQDCDQIYFDWEDSRILPRATEEDCIILFTDDDDWYAPSVFEALESYALEDQSGWIWNWSRYNGDLLTNALGGKVSAFTKNYAVLGRALKKHDTAGRCNAAHHSRILDKK